MCSTPLLSASMGSRACLRMAKAVATRDQLKRLGVPDLPQQDAA